jgi:hypothetical protein
MGSESQNSMFPKSRLDLISKRLLLAMYKYESSSLLGVTGSQVKLRAAGLGLLKKKEHLL